MARNQPTASPPPDPDQGAVLRPGRAADPVPGSALSAEERPTTASEPRAPAQPEDGEHTRAAGTSPEPSDEAGPEAIEQALAESRQRQLRLMLRQCDRILLMDFDLLAMNDWPDNYSLAAARRNRDLWVFTVMVAALVFLSGLTGFVPAWIAGGGFGAFVIVLLLGVPVVRRLYTSKPSYLDLILRRQRMMRDARAHAAHLEDRDGLIWQCARMVEFNPALKNTRFSDLLRLSEQRVLPRHLARREHVRLYLIYLLEAEKAYERAQAAFFEGNQQAIDRGWRSAVTSPERRT